jgi:hypothetical protein
MTLNCHSRGGAKQLYGVCQRHESDNRLSLLSATPQKPLRSAGPAIQNDKLDPRRVTVRYGNLRGNRDPRQAVHPGQTASAQLVFGSAGGPHRCAIVSDRALLPERGEGANPSERGPGLRHNEAVRGHAPGNKPRSTRSPSLPQLGRQLPPPVRCLACHPIMSLLSRRFWFSAFTTPATH